VLSATPTSTITWTRTPTAIFSATPIVTLTRTATPTISSEAVSALENVRPQYKIFTPNGEVNRTLRILFRSNAAPGQIQALMYDLNGRRLAGLTIEGTGPDYVAVWDGRSYSGREEPSGLYVYEIKVPDAVKHGTAVMAR
jgi:hypothetical protein